MPKANVAKTASAPKYAKLGAWLFTIAIIVSVYVSDHQAHLLIAGSRRLKVEIADTDISRTKGLSGRTSLGSSEAMLFVFPDTLKHCIWMKDMHFSLDIVWLNAQKRVVHIESNVSPASYPEVFCPAIPDRYVIELNAGTVQASGIKLTDQLRF